MTESTDAELEALFVEETGFAIDDFPAAITIDFARAVLAKWGQPSGAGEAVYQASYKNGFWQDCSRERYEYLLKAPTISSSVDWTLRILYTTPQPTQPQAGAVPLTCEWAHNEDDGFWDTECGQSWRFDDGGPKENHMNFCHCCGKPLRIKGGQHGVE